MTRFVRILAVLMAGVSTGVGAQGHAQPAAPATARAPGSIDALFEAASRGELSPIARALESERRGDVRALLRARLAAAHFDPAAARDPALARLAAGRDPALRRAALSVLTMSAFAQGDYAAAARHGRPLAEALAQAGLAEEAEDSGRAWRLAALLAARPGQRVEGRIAAGSTAARLDRVGLPRIDMGINGQAQEAVFDTGANLSVLSAETARRLGVAILEGTTPIGNGVDTSVPARIGIAERIEVAGAILTNVPFLIIEDEALTFPVPGGYDIKAILGMPVMRALGRMRMERAGRLSLLPAAAGEARAGAPNMHASGNLLYVDAAIDGAPVPLLLDTGANQSSLSALYAEANPAAVAALPTAQSGRAGAGGAHVVRVANWANAPLTLAGRGLVLPTLSITLPAPGARRPRSYGTIGASILRAFESYTLDFNAMRFELGEPVRPAS